MAYSHSQEYRASEQMDRDVLTICHGCHLIKPSKERDQGIVDKTVFFDELVEALDAQSIDY
jgi:heterodisulfide reductase subunit B